MSSIAICVGVNDYEDPTIPRLRYAAQDASRFAKILTSLGVPSARVFVFQNQQASRAEILRAIRVTPYREFNHIERLIFYFAGHGTHPNNRNKGASSVLLTSDSRREDLEGTGLTFADLISAISRLNVTELFLFFDACYVDIGDTSSLDLVGDHERGLLDTLRRPYIMCLASGPSLPAKESDDVRGGLFTHQLLQALIKVHQSSRPSVHLLLHHLNAHWRDHPDLRPFSRYVYGTNDPWLVEERNLHLQTPSSQMDLIERPQAVAIVTERILSDRAKPLWFHGPSRSGKTVLFWQVHRRLISSVYISLEEHARAERMLTETIREHAIEQLGLVSTSWAETASLDSIFDLMADAYPTSTLILDHGERISSALLEQVATACVQRGMSAVVVSRVRPLVEEQWEISACPEITVEDAQLLLSSYPQPLRVDTNELLSLSRGNYVKAMEIAEALKESGDTQPAATGESVLLRYGRAVRALVLTNGYSDIRLFAAHFGLSADDVDAIAELGWANRFPDQTVPHDQLVAIVIANELPWSNAEKQASAEYWHKELKLYHSMFKLFHFVDAILLAGSYREHLDRELASAINTLYREQQWTYLRQVSEWLKKVDHDVWVQSLMTCLEIESERGEFHSANETTSLLTGRQLDEHTEHWKHLCEARSSWWHGDYQRAKLLAAQVLEESGTQQLWSRAYLETGIAYFFEGEWKQANHCLQQVTTEDARSYAWALMMLGTTNGIRGIHAIEADRQLLRAVELLELLRDWVGLGIAWNNRGEIKWKGGEHSEALASLRRAEDLATRGGNGTDQMEICRNLLATTMRCYGPDSQDAVFYYTRLSGMNPDMQGAMQQMQVWNTLATFHAYRGELDKAREALAKAAVLTAGNKEYDIYSIANEGLLRLLRGDIDLGVSQIRKAFRLASVGENVLAVRQIFDDLKVVLGTSAIVTQIASEIEGSLSHERSSRE
ncbi:MAG: caspase family protein [Acidobacteriia bacterium]|nr:caspase family protein [Terriglobia bacterium]